MTYRRSEVCLMCHSPNLEPIITLGDQALTGVFPRADAPDPSTGPLELVRCLGACGLVQLRHQFGADEMYGANYGYRSSLNSSMVAHLREVHTHLSTQVELKAGDVVLDIGSNDGTLLSFYQEDLVRVGIDPTISKFGSYYQSSILKVPKFFEREAFAGAVGDKKAKIISSIAMFYDLPDPLAFMKDIHACLADDGIWFTEQSYLPTMLERTAYDSICHEHTEYYALHQIDRLAQEAGLTVVSASLNDMNGGSFALILAKAEGKLSPDPSVEAMREDEAKFFGSNDVFTAFANRVQSHREELRETLRDAKSSGRLIYGLGASTKGNVILQYCGITPDQMPGIAEINPDKFGCHTPGTRIPILSEEDARRAKPDAFVVFPWHFRENIIARERPYLESGGELIFPLPDISVVKA